MSFKTWFVAGCWWVMLGLSWGIDFLCFAIFTLLRRNRQLGMLKYKLIQGIWRSHLFHPIKIPLTAHQQGIPATCNWSLAKCYNGLRALLMLEKCTLKYSFRASAWILLSSEAIQRGVVSVKVKTHQRKTVWGRSFIVWNMCDTGVIYFAVTVLIRYRK